MELSQIEGSVQAEGSFGKVEISGVPPRRARRHGHAGVSVLDAGGETYIKTTFGLVRAERINGSLTVEDSNGSVKATTIHGAASVRTSFGSVALTGVDGGVDVDKSEWLGGRFRRAGKEYRGRVQRNHIALIVRAPCASRSRMAAATTSPRVLSFGKVSSELDVTASGTLGGDSLNGRIGGGGCPLQLTNSNGNIEILKATSRH